MQGACSCRLKAYNYRTMFTPYHAENRTSKPCSPEHGTGLVFFFAIIFALISAFLRLAPHAPNFAPVGALALWSGFYLPKRVGIIFPLLAMLASDAFIGFYDVRIMLAVYASFALMAFLGRLAREKHASARYAPLVAVLGSTVFYLATNFAVWANSSLYPQTAEGLLWCYTLALPFFRNTLLSDLMYGASFFAVYELARRYSPFFIKSIKMISAKAVKAIAGIVT